MVERQLPKLIVRVRFPSPAPCHPLQTPNPSSDGLPAMPAPALCDAWLLPGCPLRARSGGSAFCAECVQLTSGHLVERVGELPIPLIAGMKVDPCCAYRGMTHPVHLLAERGARFGGQCVPRLTEIMDVQVARQTRGGQRTSHGLEKLLRRNCNWFWSRTSGSAPLPSSSIVPAAGSSFPNFAMGQRSRILPVAASTSTRLRGTSRPWNWRSLTTRWVTVRARGSMTRRLTLPQTHRYS
jgi:hypothetical protein